MKIDWASNQIKQQFTPTGIGISTYKKGENWQLADSHQNIMNSCYIVIANWIICTLADCHPPIGKKDFLNQ